MSFLIVITSKVNLIHTKSTIPKFKVNIGKFRKSNFFKLNKCEWEYWLVTKWLSGRSIVWKYTSSGRLKKIIGQQGGLSVFYKRISL